MGDKKNNWLIFRSLKVLEKCKHQEFVFQFSKFLISLFWYYIFSSFYSAGTNLGDDSPLPALPDPRNLFVFTKTIQQFPVTKKINSTFPPIHHAHLI